MQNTTHKIHIQYVSIGSLHGTPGNPRYWSEKAREDLRQSILRFGLTEPLLVNAYPKRKNRILSGHFRWTIAKELGIKTVPVVFVNIASEKKERELLLRMNANQGAWDLNLLKEFDIDLLLNAGFDDAELSAIWDQDLSIEDDDWDIDRELPAAKTTKIKVGDLFQLGPHRLVCMDSTDPNTVKKLVGTEKIDVINIDFPYNISLDYNAGIGGKQNYGGTTNDKKSDPEYRKFVKDILQNALSVSNKDCHVFGWLDEKYVGMMQEVYKELGIRFRRLCSWVKGNQNPTPQIAFNRTVELCAYGTVGSPMLSANVKNLNEILNKEVGTGNRLIDDVLDILDIWLVRRLSGNEMEHPTMKPPSLYEKSLRRCSKPGDRILDLTAGSGSLLIGCEALKRRAYLAEIEPVFCQLIINRYEKLTSNKAKKIS